jgi:hypothetical protein
MWEIAVVGMCTCAIVAELLALFRGFRRLGIVPEMLRGSMLEPVRSAETKRLLPDAGVRFSPRPGLPARLRGGRRELLYRPPVCSRVRCDSSRPPYGAVSTRGGRSERSLIGIGKGTKARRSKAFSCSRANRI